RRMFVQVPSYTALLGGNSATCRSVEDAVRLDVDLGAGQFGGEARILALFADGERKLVVRNQCAHGLGTGIQNERAGDLGGRKCIGDERGELRIVIDDVDLLSGKLFSHRANTTAEFTDAGPFGVDRRIVGDDGDLGAVTGFARE